MGLTPSAGLRELLGAYALDGAARPRGGVSGERRGLGTGSSVELEDRRSFQPGDDLRRLDWRALARTDKMLTRQYREEVSPVLEVVVDASASMAFLDDKHQLTIDLVALLVELARAGGWRARAHLADGRGRRAVSREALWDGDLSLDGEGRWSDAVGAVASGLAPGALVVLVSDLLVPSPPQSWLPALAGRAGQLALIQVLGGEDLDPPRGAWRLIDAETGTSLERQVDEAAVRAYLDRLGALNAAVDEAALRSGARCVRLRADGGVAAAAAQLAEAGLLAPRGGLGMASAAGGG